MENIYTAQFGSTTVRFILKDEDVFISRDDLYSAIGECFTPKLRALGANFIDGGLTLIADSKDNRAVILGESSIGQAVHFHAVGNLLNSLGSLTDVDSDELRESSYRINALIRWYVETITLVDEYFGRTVVDMINSVKNRIDRINPPLTVNVTRDDESGMWVAACDALFLATEANTFDDLQERVWEIAPDCIEANDFPIDLEHLRLSFVVNQEASSHQLHAAH